MDRLAAASILLVLLGASLIVGAPPDPQFSVHVSTVDLPDDESAVAAEDLSEENRELFRSALDGDVRLAEEPDFDERYVTYEGETYEVIVSAHEGSVFSLLLSPLGGLLVVAGGLAGAYRYRARLRDRLGV